MVCKKINCKLYHNIRISVDPGWKVLAEAFGIIETVISEYVSFNKKWNNSSSDFRFPKKQDGYIPRTNNSKPIANERNGHANNSNSFTTFGRYKTKMCRDVLNGRPCPRGSTCTYAHVYEDLRPPQENEIKNDYHDNNEISANGGGGQPLHDQNGQPRIISNELSNMQQGEMIPMPIIPLQQMHRKVSSVRKFLVSFNFKLKIPISLWKTLMVHSLTWCPL